jgi:hypothetical protein
MQRHEVHVQKPIKAASLVFVRDQRDNTIVALPPFTRDETAPMSPRAPPACVHHNLAQLQRIESQRCESDADLQRSLAHQVQSSCGDSSPRQFHFICVANSLLALCERQQLTRCDTYICGFVTSQTSSMPDPIHWCVVVGIAATQAFNSDMKLSLLATRRRSAAPAVSSPLRRHSGKSVIHTPLLAEFFFETGAGSCEVRLINVD